MSFADIVRQTRRARATLDPGGFPPRPRCSPRLTTGPDPRLHHVSTHFHASFAWPSSPNDVILESSDGVKFYADLRLPAVYSPFFDDLSDVPAPHPDNAFHHTLPLPSATATSYGLEIFLLAVRHTEAFPFPSISRDVLLYGILDAIDMSDVYDIPMFADLTPAILLDAFKPYPFLQYTMAAVLHDEAAAIAAMRRTLPLRMDDLPRKPRRCCSNGRRLTMPG